MSDEYPFLGYLTQGVPDTIQLTPPPTAGKKPPQMSEEPKGRRVVALATAMSSLARRGPDGRPMSRDIGPRSGPLAGGGFVELGSPEAETGPGQNAITTQNETIYQRMADLGVVLDAMADEIRCLQPSSPRTLNLVRQMKNLRTELEMEVLTRRGY